MRTIKIQFVGFWQDFNPEINIVYKILKKHYKVEITDNPDYIICSVFPDRNGNYYPYCDYPQVRILYSGENYLPDFNLVDYAISSYPLSLFDRHFCFPVCLNNYGNHFDELWNKQRVFSETDLRNKTIFANFIFSHDSEYSLRSEIYNILSNYKYVASPGPFLNNMKLDTPLSFTDNSKIDFQKQSKFTICFESTSHKGFVTEKITDAFLSDTIPIYYGSSTVKSIFNENAFIFCPESICLEEVVERVVELDKNDEKYIEMMNRPVFNESFDYPAKLKELETFIINIFEQPIEKAFRRSRVYSPAHHNAYLQKCLETSVTKKNESKKYKYYKIIKKLLKKGGKNGQNKTVY